ncbi:integrase catalytic domain-containing protein, partial [Klebsiella pneumoniae]|uniref:integrase catalytic domain-containing protein n=1 Tax=Klebsiella pneumoniae TaxID=573 RepID=UPI003531C0E1
MGPTPVMSKGGYSYYVVFIDDFTRYVWIYFLKHKSEVMAYFKLFHSLIKNQFDTSIKNFRSDSGGEYMSNEFQNYLKENEIIHQRSCPRTPQQNGVSERKHRHIIETARTLLLAKDIPKNFWAEAVLSSVYLINRMPSKKLHDISPFQKLFNIEPNYDRLKVFGCKCFILDNQNDK